VPGSRARQSCPAVVPGSRARQSCPAVVPGSRARQSCPAVVPGSRARRVRTDLFILVFKGVSYYLHIKNNRQEEFFFDENLIQLLRDVQICTLIWSI
jgi:hypothetical protein